MKTVINFFYATLILMIFMGCSTESNDVVSQDIDNLSKVTRSSVPVLERPGGFPDGDFLEITGASSTLHRNKNGITLNFNTNGLIPGNAYTIWLVVFGDAPGPPNSHYAAGHIAGGSEIGNFSARLNVGTDFQNPLTAEVHVALRTHGQAVPGMIPGQIQTFEEGCVTILPEGPGRIWPDSDEVGYCANIQVAIHDAN